MHWITLRSHVFRLFEFIDPPRSFGKDISNNDVLARWIVESFAHGLIPFLCGEFENFVKDFKFPRT